MTINYKLFVQLLVVLQFFLWDTFAVRLRAKEYKVLTGEFFGSNNGNLQPESIAKSFTLTPIDNSFRKKGLYNSGTEPIVKSKDTVEPTTESTVDSKLESTDKSEINSTLGSTKELEINSILESKEPAINSTLESTEEPEINSILESKGPAINSTLEFTKESTINSILESKGPAINSTLESTEEPAINSTLESTEEPEINSILESKEPAINSTLESTKESTINSILGSKGPAINSTLESTEEPEINSILESTEESEINSTLGSTEEPEINSILGSKEPAINSTLEFTKESTINSILGSKKPAINSTLESTEEPEINSILESTEKSEINSTLGSTEEPEINSILESKEPAINSTLESTEEPEINSILGSKEPAINSTLESTKESTINSILGSKKPAINSILESTEEPEINSILESKEPAINSTLESTEKPTINSILGSKEFAINSTLESTEERAIDYTRKLFEVRNDTENVVSAEPNLVELEHKAQHNEASNSKEEEKELDIKQKGDESYYKQVGAMENKFEELVPVYFNSFNVSKASNESLISSYNDNNLSINALKPSPITLDQPKYIRRSLKYDMKEPEIVDFMEGIFPEVTVTNVDNSEEKKEFNEDFIQDTLEDVLADKPTSITGETVRAQPSPEFEGEEKIVEFLNRAAIEDASQGANQQSAEVTETLPQDIYGGQYVLVEFNNFEPNYISSEQLKILELKLKTAPEGSHIIVKNTFEPQLFEYYQSSIKELDQDLQMKILKLIDEDKAARMKDLKLLESENDTNEIKENQTEVIKMPEESPEVFLEQGSSSLEFEDIVADDTEDEIEDEAIEN
ncbi:hypothetical protein ACR3K2_22030 [Cryptosporidium serpentis]